MYEHGAVEEINVQNEQLADLLALGCNFLCFMTRQHYT